MTIVRMYFCAAEDMGVLLQDEVREKRGKRDGVDQLKASKITHCNESTCVLLKTKVGYKGSTRSKQAYLSSKKGKTLRRLEGCFNTKRKDTMNLSTLLEHTVVLRT